MYVKRVHMNPKKLMSCKLNALSKVFKLKSHSCNICNCL